MSFEGEVGVDQGGLTASLYQSYFGKLFAAPALCESYEGGLPLPAPGAAEGAMQACIHLLAKMPYPYPYPHSLPLPLPLPLPLTRRVAGCLPRCSSTAGARSPSHPSCGIA